MPTPCSPVTVPPVADLMNADLLFNNAKRYDACMSILSFSCTDTQKLFEGARVARWVSIERPALRKLAQLDWSAVLDDLRVPPGNRLEALKGDRKGQHSIRINEQWRVCFRWTAEGAFDVEIVDYH
jgi:proteic killer suppression protein